MHDAHCIHYETLCCCIHYEPCPQSKHIGPRYPRPALRRGRSLSAAQRGSQFPSRAALSKRATSHTTPDGSSRDKSLIHSGHVDGAANLRSGPTGQRPTATREKCFFIQDMGLASCLQVYVVHHVARFVGLPVPSPAARRGTRPHDRFTGATGTNERLPASRAIVQSFQALVQ